MDTDHPNAAYILMHHTDRRNSNLTSVTGARGQPWNRKEAKLESARRSHVAARTHGTAGPRDGNSLSTISVWLLNVNVKLIRIQIPHEHLFLNLHF